MVLYTGEAVRVRADVIDPDTDEPLVIPDGDPVPTAKIAVWSPGDNPARDPLVRDSPYATGDMTYRATERDFIVYIHTRGPGGDDTIDGIPKPLEDKWEPGRWSFQVEVDGNFYVNWEYGTFRLAE